MSHQRMKRACRGCFVCIFSLISTFIWSQDRAIRLVDETDQTPLVNAEISIGDITLSYTDSYGFAKLRCPLPTGAVIVKYFGAFDTITRAELPQCGSLESKTIVVKVSVNLSTVTVNSTMVRSDVQANRTTYSPAILTQDLPMMIGQPDLMRGLSLQPGISLGQEGSASIFIRGGSPDQTLILLDDAPLYNATHFGGLLSLINPDVVQSLNVYKSIPPLHYGGRLGGLIDIRLKNGSRNQWHGKYGIGLLSANAYVDGPLSKTTSLLVGARLGYFELANLGKDRNSEENIFDYRMRDIVIKMTHQFGKSNSLFISSYISKDVNLLSENNYGIYFPEYGRVDRQYTRNLSQYGNKTLTVRSYLELSSKLSAILSGYYSQYNNGTEEISSIFSGTDEIEGSLEILNSSVQDAMFSINSTLNFQTYRLNFGFDTGYKWFDPMNAETEDASIDQPSLEAHSSSITFYGGTEVDVNDKLSVNSGLRLTRYSNREYQLWLPEFRLVGNYQFSQSTSVTFETGNSVQNVHMLSSGGLGLNTDIFIAASGGLPVQKGWQVGLSGKYELSKYIVFSSAGYYRKMNNVLFFQNFDFQNQNQDFVLRQIRSGGNGYSTGLENNIKFRKKKVSGELSYTLSKTERQFENLNGGRYFPFRYDRTHDFAVNSAYRINDKWTIGGAYIYQTGIAVTTPVARLRYTLIDIQQNIVPNINNARFPSYQRFDLFASLTWTGRRENTNRVKVSIYNVLNRVNPTFYRQSQFLQFNADFPDGRVVTSSSRVGQFGFLPTFYYEHEF